MSVIRKIPVQAENELLDDGFVSVSVIKAGKRVEGIVSDRITGIEEEVMKWTNAGHVHAWFERNLEKVKGSHGRVPLPSYKIESLLDDCEKVIFASQLVPTERLGKGSWWSSATREAASNTRMEIKNVNTAYRVMPLANDFGEPDAYDEKYLNAVEETRKWCLKTLLQSYGNSSMGDLYYSWDV